MLNIIHKEECSGCAACMSICPVQCIKMSADSEGFLYPSIEVSKCINCFKCDHVCPILSTNEIKHSSGLLNQGYACINTDNDIKAKSSSGGVFTLLAQNVIAEGGIVFGAAFNSEFDLLHSQTRELSGLEQFRGSKYLQSSIGTGLEEVEKALKLGIKVLFSGTPCQITGLQSYLNKEYSNLLCIDFVCHGVPSPKVFKLYRTEQELKFGSKTSKIDFRNKDLGWKSFSFVQTFSNGSEYRNSVTIDTYMKGFSNNLYLRPSCYDCQSKSPNRDSDITLADFWGIEHILPDLDDDKGISLVGVNTETGEEAFKKIRDYVVIKEVDLNEAFKYNIAAIKSMKSNPNRSKFFARLDQYPDNVSELISQYTKRDLYRIILNRLKRIFIG